MKMVELLFQKAEQMISMGLLQPARTLLEEAEGVDPFSVSVQTALGEVYGQLNDHVASVCHLQKAEQLNGEQLDVSFMLGYEYCRVGQYREALKCFDRLLSVAPRLPALHRLRGVALEKLGKKGSALQAYQEALRLQPDYSEVYHNIANLLFDLHQYERAEQYFRKAISLTPENPTIYNNLGRVYRQQGRMEEALDCVHTTLELNPANRVAVSNILYGSCYINKTPEQLAQMHFDYANRYYPEPAIPPIFLKTGLCDRKMRIGYLTADFGNHPVANFLEPVLQQHNRDNFEVFCYANRSVADETTLRMQNLDVIWRTVFGVSALDVARSICDDGIDVLVDLSGHSAGHRLDVMALRAAPVQCSWIGYPHSTGLAQIDYYISDTWCDPPGATDHLYSEKVWRLPRVFSCYLPPPVFAAVSPPPYQITGRITFGSFNNFAKVNDAMIAVWSTILKSVPDSRLFLKASSMEGALTKRNVYERFARHGIQPERINLQPFCRSITEHLDQYAKVDIALDTYPYHGTTTTCEALFMGVPVVTMAGSNHLSRVGVSFLHAVGLYDLVAANLAEYVDKACVIAQDHQRREQLRYSLRGLMAQSPLMDAAGVTKEVEDAYHCMYSAWLGKGKEKEPGSQRNTQV